MTPFLRSILLVVGTTLAVLPSLAQEAPTTQTQLEQTISRGIEFLREQGQDEQGRFSPRMGSGITSLCVTAALRLGVPLDDPMVAKGLAAIESYIQPDGGIYGSPRLKNYETCVAIVCLAEANQRAGDGRYDKTLADAEALVRGFQIGAGGTAEKSDLHYGGVGYSGKENPDLSNTTYLLEALRAVGAEANDEAIQRALVFVSRCQNLKGAANDTQFADKVNDGGFYYVIPTERVDPSTSDRYTANGGLRSYGSMTYSGFKSLVYAGLTKDDPRTEAALEWIRKNYSLKQNPGQGLAGLYYYFHTFGSALSASQLATIEVDEGGERNWRQDLADELSQTQNSDGSWTNSNRQWFENDPNLCTAFALLALSYCEEAESSTTSE